MPFPWTCHLSLAFLKAGLLGLVQEYGTREDMIKVAVFDQKMETE